MDNLLYANGATSTLTANISAADVTIGIVSADGAKFPTIAANQAYYLVLERKNTSAKEVVKCSAHAAASAAMTIVRAQDGTTALTFVIGDIVSMRLVAGVMLPEALIAPTLLNSWVDVAGVPLRYYKDPFGIVRFQGEVQSGVAATIMTLPAGYRPSIDMKFTCSNGASHGEVNIIAASGAVQQLVGANAYYVLNGINFRAA